MQIATYVQSFFITHWIVILSYLAAGGGLSISLQFVKRLRKWESAAWIEFVLGSMTTILAAANYVINNYTTSPLPTIFGNFAPKILLAALLMHRILVSPLSTLIEQRLVPWVTELKVAIAQLKAEKAAVSAAANAPKTPPADPTNTFS